MKKLIYLLLFVPCVLFGQGAFVKAVNSFADLQAVDDVFNSAYMVRYGTIDGDGLGGMFLYSSSSTETEDGINILEATGVGSGRWKRVDLGVYASQASETFPFSAAPVLKFDGTDDFIQSQVDSDELSISDGTKDVPVTWSGWIKPENVGNIALFSKGTTQLDGEYLCLILNGAITIVLLDKSTLGYRFGYVYAADYLDLWTHFAIVYRPDNPDGERFRFYINGNPKPGSEASYGYTTSQNDAGLFYFGNSCTIDAPPLYPNNYKGQLKSFNFVRRALSFAEVQHLFALGKPSDIDLVTSYSEDYISDFSIDVDGWDEAFVEVEIAGNIDGVSDGTTSKDNVFRITAERSDIANIFAITAPILTTNAGNYTVSYDYYFPTTNLEWGKIKALTWRLQPTVYVEGVTPKAFLKDGSVSTPLVAGTWTNHTFTIEAQENFGPQFVATFSSPAGVAPDTDLMYIHNVKVTRNGSPISLSTDGFIPGNSRVAEYGTLGRFHVSTNIVEVANAPKSMYIYNNDAASADLALSIRNDATTNGIFNMRNNGLASMVGPLSIGIDDEIYNLNNGALTVFGHATITNDVYVGSDLIVTNGAVVLADVVVGDNLIVTNAANLLAAVDIGTTITVGTDATITNDTFIGNDLWVTNNVDVAGTLNVTNVTGFYEEGTWTPVLTYGTDNTGVTHSIQNGNYTRIGNFVHCQFTIALSAEGSGTGTITVAGLPFTAKDVASDESAFALSYSNWAALTGALIGEVNENTTTFDVRETSAAGVGLVDESNSTDTSILRGSFTYMRE